ncbi:Ig-like domain-containing protein [Leptospira kanakyensis]|uniref:Ig-like domain-containing protein n=1 Tax=Leptospira kanakyensis TaxID=2484968 RepID=UPI00223D7673|nr:Ig-like domain-containing protein [Leptospira kanakyensis]MCW7468649.1 Ig-like domain-containing protein [Leptospira kanakyensis]
MNHRLNLRSVSVILSLWMLLGNCYFNPFVQPIVNPVVEEEPEVAGAGFIAALASAPPPSPYFFLVSSSPADNQNLTSSPSTFSFTFSETLDIDASDPSTWITTNILQAQPLLTFYPTVTISENKFDLSLSNALALGYTYIITFGSGIKVKSGKLLAPETKVTFTCTTCPPT